VPRGAGRSWGRRWREGQLAEVQRYRLGAGPHGGGKAVDYRLVSKADVVERGAGRTDGRAHRAILQASILNVHRVVIGEGTLHRVGAVRG